MLTYYEHAAERMSEMARDLPATDGKPTRPGEERMQAHAMTQKPPDPSAMYRWKEKMSPEDVAAFDAAAGELLADLGYEVGCRAATRGDRRVSDPKFIALTPELHDYVVRHGAREDAALAAVRESTAALGDIAVMQISPDQGALMTMLTRLVGADAGDRARHVHRLLGDLHRPRARRGRPADRLRARPRAGRDRRANFAAAGVADRIDIARRPRRRDARRPAPRTQPAPTTSPSSTPTRPATRTTTSRCLELLRPGGLIVLDNVLRGGDRARSGTRRRGRPGRSRR